MILERPLRNVPTPVLYALHRAIEKQAGLIAKEYRSQSGDCCAIGSMGDTYKEAMSECVKYGLTGPGYVGFGEALTEHGLAVSMLNFECRGTPKERREFMLRHILSELRSRGKKLGGNSPHQPQKKEVKA